jgi:hypothetical protein
MNFEKRMPHVGGASPIETFFGGGGEFLAQWVGQSRV